MRSGKDAGTYRSEWKVMDATHVELRFTIPFGCEAELELPFSKLSNQVLTAGEYKYQYETTIPMKL